MNLKKILTKDSILPELKADTKQGVIEEIVAALVASGKITGRAAAIKAVLDREAKMSTGLHNGVAIPHGTTDSVDRLIVAVGIHRTGVDFAADDKSPSRIIVLTLFPADRVGPHIQFLAEIGKVLGRAELRDRLLKASSADEIFAILTA